MSITGLDPTSGPIDPGGNRRLAARPLSLDGAVVGLVCNGLGRGEQFLDAVLKYISEHDALAGSVKVVKGSVSVPPEPGDWARLTGEATVAITGFGG
jgi:hypothetical protein